MPDIDLTPAEKRAMSLYRITVLARRLSDKDLDKRLCESCGKPLVRHEGEKMQNWRRRRTCDRACSKKRLYGDKPKKAAEVSCVACVWSHEDSDFGEHCGNCNSGSAFRRKV